MVDNELTGFQELPEGDGLIRSIIRRRARKEHKCDSCGGAIKIGDAYEYFTGITQVRTGHYFSTKRCRDCVNSGSVAVTHDSMGIHFIKYAGGGSSG